MKEYPSLLLPCILPALGSFSFLFLERSYSVEAISRCRAGFTKSGSRKLELPEDNIKNVRINCEICIGVCRYVQAFVQLLEITDAGKL